jgi:CheY-like chemotaxis protein
MIPVIVSAWFGGLGPGLLAALLSGLASDFFLTKSHFPLFNFDMADRQRLTLFLTISGLLAWLIEMTRVAHQRVGGGARDAEQRQIELEEQIVERERAREERERLITERERLIAELETERARLKAIVEHIPAGVILAEAPTGQIVMVNPQVEQILGRTVGMSPDIESYREWLTYEVNNRPVQGHESVLARTLQGEDMPSHEVRLAYDGQSALEEAQSFRPEVMFLDLDLPKMDGYEVARRLRLEPAMRDMTLVAMTGYGQEEDRQRTQEAGFQLHLVKPLDFNKVEELLSSALEKYAL